MDNPIIDLFAGGGGMSYGFKEAAFKVAFACDIEKEVAKTYTHNLPETIYFVRNIHHLKPEEILEETQLHPGETTVLLAGAPCQGFSTMGLRNPDDPRNRLLEEILRFAEIIKPMWIVIENVRGLLTMEKGKPVRMIYRGLSKLGYNCKHKLLNMMYYGIPQMRKRVFFIANNTGDPIVFPKKTNYKPALSKLDEFIDESAGGLMPIFTVRDAIGDLPFLNAGEEKEYYARPAFSEYQKLMREGASQKLYNHRAPNHTEKVIERISKAGPGEKVPYLHSFEKKRLKWDSPSNTILDGPRPTWHYAHPENNRGLSVRERARIMSFPDKFVFVGQLPKQRMITGDAVPPLMAKAIAVEIRKFL